MTKRPLQWVYLVEFEGIPRAIFSSFRAASAYTKERRRSDPGFVVTTTKIQSYLKEEVPDESSD